jgi:hypothetical protein
VRGYEWRIDAWAKGEGRPTLSLNYRKFQVHVTVRDVADGDVDHLEEWAAETFGVPEGEFVVDAPDWHDECPSCRCDEAGASVRFETWVPARDRREAERLVSQVELPPVRKAVAS